MGVLIIANRPAAGSPYDQWKLYSASSEGGTYSLVATQDLTDLTYYDTSGTSTTWYKISYYDSDGDVESEKSDAIKGQSTDYCTVEDIRGLLQVSEITDSTNPNIQDVIKVINRAEDKIDNRTGHAWRQRYSGTKSGQHTDAQYEYYDIRGEYVWHTGIPIHLQHRAVKSLDSNEGDAIEYWNGSEWEDWLANKTEGRGGDFWVDYARGILYVNYRRWHRKIQAIRMKYRYGESWVPGDIEDACAKLAAIDFLTGMDARAFTVQEDKKSMNHAKKVEVWSEDVNNTIHNFKEFQIPTIL